MSHVRRSAHTVALLLAFVPAASAGGATDAVPAVAPSPAAWSGTASAYTYVLPHGRDYVNPNVAADHGWLHLEGRYNYESQDTGSLWVGYNVTCGSDLALGLTPMIGGVFGHLNGFAPGYMLSLSYGGVALSGQGEYVFDTGAHLDSFFYSWTELSYALLDWARAGLVIQRTKAYQTEFSLQRGLLLGLSSGRFELTTYVFDIGQGAPPVVLGLAVDF